MACGGCGTGSVGGPWPAWFQTAYVMAWAADAWGAAGRHVVDAGGRVRWWGVWWYGVPMPVRVAAWAAMVWRMERDAPEMEAMMKLPGCGCVCAAKDAAERAWMAARRAAAAFACVAWGARVCSLPGPSAAG